MTERRVADRRPGAPADRRRRSAVLDEAVRRPDQRRPGAPADRRRPSADLDERRSAGQRRPGVVVVVVKIWVIHEAREATDGL